MQMPAGDYAIVERDEHCDSLAPRRHPESFAVGIHIFTQDLEALHAELEQHGALGPRGSYASPGATVISM